MSTPKPDKSLGASTPLAPLAPLAALAAVAAVFAGSKERKAGPPPASHPRDATHRLVKIRAIRSEAVPRVDVRQCPRFEPESDPAEKVLRSGDLLLPSRGDKRDVVLIETVADELPLVASGSLYVVRPRTELVEPGYLAWWLNSHKLQALLRDAARGSKVAFIPLRVVQDLPVPLPDLETQRATACYHRLAAREHEILSAIRDRRRQLVDQRLNNIVAGSIPTGAAPA